MLNSISEQDYCKIQDILPDLYATYKKHDQLLQELHVLDSKYKFKLNFGVSELRESVGFLSELIDALNDLEVVYPDKMEGK